MSGVKYPEGITQYSSGLFSAAAKRRRKTTKARQERTETKYPEGIAQHSPGLFSAAAKRRQNSYPGSTPARTTTLKGLRNKWVRLSFAFALSFVACLCSAQRRIIFIQSMRFQRYAVELQTLLGPDYEVISGFRARALDGPSPNAVVWISDFTPADNGWAAWAANEDSFAESFGHLLARPQAQLSRAKQRLKLLLPPGIQSRIYHEDYIPLATQLARENAIEVINLSQSHDPVKDLYLALVTAQHNPGTWHVVFATSEQADEGPAKNAIDNNPNTYWHTRYDPNPTKVPHEIVIDFGSTQSLRGFSYLARQDGGVNGRVKNFEVYVSDDPNKWSEPVLKGTLQNTMDEQKLLFALPVQGRYMKFRALSEVNGNIWASAAELGILPTGSSDPDALKHKEHKEAPSRTKSGAKFLK